MRRRKHLRYFLLSILFFLVLGTIGILHVAANHLPAPLVRRLENALSSDTLSVELDHVSVSLRDGIDIHQANLLRRGGLEPEATALRVHIGLEWIFAPFPSIRHAPVHVDSLTLRPSVLDLFDEDGDSAAGGTSGSGGFPEIPFAPVRVGIDNVTVLPPEDAGGKLSPCDIRGLIFEFSTRPDAVVIDRVRAVFTPRHAQHPEKIKGGLEIRAGRKSRIQGHFAGTLSPDRAARFLRLFDIWTLPKHLTDFEFPSAPPWIDVSLHLAPESENVQQVSVTISAEDFLFNNVPYLAMDGTAQAYGDARDWNGVRFLDFKARRPEGTLRGDLHFDFLRHGVTVDATSSIDLNHLARTIGILTKFPWKDVSFDGQCDVAASGFYGFSQATEPTDLRGTLAVPAASYLGLPVGNAIASPFAVEKGGVAPDILFPRIRAGFYGGELTARARISANPATEEWTLDATGRVVRASVARIDEAIFHTSDPNRPGTADAAFDIRCGLESDMLRSMTGTQSIRISKSNIYQTPLFAGLTDFLSDTIPGLGTLVTQDDLTCDAKIYDNGLHFGGTNGVLRIEGPLFSVSAEGDYYFSDYLNSVLKVSLLRNKTLVGKILKVALYPVSKLFEFQVTGPVSNPSWSPTTLTLSGAPVATDEQKYGTGP